MQPHLHFAVVMSQQLHGHTELDALGLPTEGACLAALAETLAVVLAVVLVDFFITLTSINPFAVIG